MPLDPVAVQLLPATHAPQVDIVTLAEARAPTVAVTTQVFHVANVQHVAETVMLVAV